MLLHLMYGITPSSLAEQAFPSLWQLPLLGQQLHLEGKLGRQLQGLDGLMVPMRGHCHPPHSSLPHLPCHGRPPLCTCLHTAFSPPSQADSIPAELISASLQADCQIKVSDMSTGGGCCYYVGTNQPCHSLQVQGVT